jgi:hypothetical protein
VVEDFGVKYVGKEYTDHLIQCMQEMYELTEDWTGDLYCRIKLNWDYKARMLDILMLGYIKNTPKVQTSHPPQ